MKMKTLAVAGMAAFMGFMAAPAMSADYVGQPQDGVIQCLRPFTSPMLDLPRPELVSAVNQKYDQSLEVSERESVIYNGSQLFTWANEAKVSCAKAVGFLKHGEANAEQISQCDCFYSRMRMLMH